jgi:hypothetical protein
MPGPFKQGVADWATVRLQTAVGADVTGVAFNDGLLAFILQKAGAAPAAKPALIAGDWVETGKGFYQVRLTAADLSTSGTFTLVATYNSVSFAVDFRVLANDLADAYARLGAPAGASLAADVATRAPASTAVSSADLTPTRAAKLDDLDAAITTRAAAATAVSSADYTPARAVKLDDLDATISSRLAAAAYTAPDNAGIAALGVVDAAIQAKTDGLPSDPADQSLLIAAIGALAAPDNAAILAIKAKTDALPASPANEATSAAIQATSAANGVAIAIVAAEVARALGLLDDNTVREVITMTGDDVADALIYHYDTAAHAAAHPSVIGIVEEYAAHYDYSAPGKLSKATVTRVL